MQPMPPHADRRAPTRPAAQRRTAAPRGRRVGEALPPLFAPPSRSASASVAAERLSGGGHLEIRAAARTPAQLETLCTPPNLPGVVGRAAPTTTAARHVGGHEAETEQQVTLFSSVDTNRPFSIDAERGLMSPKTRYMHDTAVDETARLVLSATRIQSRWRGLSARRLWLKLKRTVQNISWVLVCTTADASGNPSLQTIDLIVRLETKPLQVMHFSSPDRRRYYVVVSATDDDLFAAAEDMKLRMFLKPKKIFNKVPGPHFGDEVEVGGPEWFGGTCEYVDSARHEFIPASQLPLYIQGTPPAHDDIPLPQELGGPSFFNSGERQRITRHIIESMGEPIDLIDAVERYKFRKTVKEANDDHNTFDTKADSAHSEITCIREFFPLHHDEEMNFLYHNWASLGLVGKHIKNATVEMTKLRPKAAWAELCRLVHQPLHLIRNYYGERIALYYAFVGAYTRGLMLPMVLGVACQMEYWFGAGYFDFGGIEGSWTGILYSLLMSLWSVYFLAKWSRLEGELRFVWGTELVVTHDHTRYAFTKSEENPYRYNPLTEANERAYGSGWKRAAKFVPTVLFVVVCVAGVVLSGLFAIYIKSQGSLWNAVGSNLNFLSIVIFQTLYNFVSERLNDWENWQTQDEWDDSFIKKLFLFQFVNNFFFLFFLAYFKYASVFGTEGSCKYNEEKGRDSCMEELELNMVIVFALKTWGQQILEVSLPFIKAWVRHKTIACSKKCSQWTRVCLRSKNAAKRLDLLENTPHSAPGTKITFSALTAEEKNELLDELTVHKYEPGQVIIVQGKAVTDEEPALFIISKGFASVVIDDIEKPVTLGRGHNFGERSLLMREPRSASIKAIDHCTVLGLSRATYKLLGLSRLKWKSADYDDINTVADKAMVLCKQTIQAALTQAVTTKVEKEYKLEAYTDLDAFKDFNEMVIQFGYITLFAVALPIAPVLAVLNNFFEIRGDAFALCKGSRRREYQTKQTIGSWYTVLEVLSLAAVITNALLTGFVNSTVADLDPEIDGNLYKTQIERMNVSRLWMWVFIFEHIMLVARTVMQHVIGSEAEWVNLQRNLVKKRIKEDIRMDSSNRVRRRRISQTSEVIDAFVTQLKKKTDSQDHVFRMLPCTVMVRNIVRNLATDNGVARVFGVHGTVLSTTVRVRDGVAKSWGLVTFSDSATAFQALQKGSSGIFKVPMSGVNHADLLKLTIQKVDMDHAMSSDGAFGQVWRLQVAKVDKAHKKYEQEYSNKTLRQMIQQKRALLSLTGGLSGGFLDIVNPPSIGSELQGPNSLGSRSELKSTQIVSTANAATVKTSQVPYTTPQVGQRANAESEEICTPRSAAVSPMETPPLSSRGTHAQPQTQLKRTPPVTPGLNESIETVFARLDVSKDGELDKAEIGQMIALLRAQATDAAADEDWLQPTELEIASALREMDRDGSEGISFQEFKAWWNRKNREGEFAASPAMWGADLQSSDEEDQLQSHPSIPSNDRASLSSPVLDPTPASADRVVIDVADYEEEHRDVVMLFQEVDADRDGALQHSEVAALLVRLRAKATDSAPEAAWLSPTAEEVSKAMEFMDLDGNGSVSIEEFLEWWDVKGGWDYAGDPSEWD